MIDQTRFIALDFETSGVDPRRNAAIQLGVAYFEGPDIVSEAEWLICPTRNKKGYYTREYDLCSMEFSGIGWPALKRAPTARQVATELDQWADRHRLHDAMVVAYRASFDMAFYSEFLFDAGDWPKGIKGFVPFTSPLLGPWLCAYQMARSKIPHGNVPSFSLDEVANVYGIARTATRHSALEDARIAGCIYNAMRGVQ